MGGLMRFGDAVRARDRGRIVRKQGFDKRANSERSELLLPCLSWVGTGFVLGSDRPGALAVSAHWPGRTETERNDHNFEVKWQGGKANGLSLPRSRRKLASAASFRLG